MTQLPRCYYAITKGVATKRVAIKAATKIKPVLCNTLFSHVYIFVFWNDYEISSDTVFLSFILKNIVLIIKHSGKVNFYFFIELCTFHLSSSAKLKIHFSWKENLKKCSSFEEQKSARCIRGNIYSDIIVLSSFSSTKRCLEFIEICFTREKKCFYQISWGNEVNFTNMMYVSPKISAHILSLFFWSHLSFSDKLREF